jgi:hypothetical protein
MVSEGEHLLTESTVSRNAHAVLAHHTHNRAPVVLKDWHNLKFIQIIPTT